MKYLITYDIEDDKKHEGGGYICTECGHRAKKSDFLECDIDG